MLSDHTIHNLVYGGIGLEAVSVVTLVLYLVQPYWLRTARALALTVMLPAWLGALALLTAFVGG